MKLLPIFLVATLAISALAWDPSDIFKAIDNPDEDLTNFTQIQQFFHLQLLDHSEVFKNEISTWSQRFWIVPDFFKRDLKSPILLILCGEYTCEGVTRSRLFPIELAREMGALVVVLEHRFYGLSQPFTNDNLSIDNLRYLTVDQALGDIAYFTNWLQESGNFSVTKENPVVTIGGSYAGALSAWFREKYPFITVGAWASSAVINSFIDFPEFDEEVLRAIEKSGPECVAKVRNLNHFVESQIISHSNADIKKKFNAAKLTDEEFLFYWADMISDLVQFGRRTMLCNLLETFSTVESQFEAVRQYALNHTTPTSYGSYYLSGKEYDPKVDGSRQWAWQQCSELGWFNTAPRNMSMALRSVRLNITFYKNWCEDIFGKKVWPVKGLANLQRGGKRIEATNLIITNGIEDPWRLASIDESKVSGVTVYTIDCEDCAHVVDLMTPSKEDSWSLWWARTKIRRNIGSWVGQYWMHE